MPLQNSAAQQKGRRGSNLKYAENACELRSREQGPGQADGNKKSTASDPARIEKILELRRAIAEGTYRIPAEILAESLIRSADWSRSACQGTLA